MSPPSRWRRRTVVLTSALLVAAAAAPVLAHVGNDPRPGATKWDLETRITNTAKLQGGLDPSVASDSHGTLFAAASVETAISPDESGALPVRVSPWLWTSVDHGKSWHDIPVSPLALPSRLPALQTDLVVTGDDVVVVAQTGLGITRISRWKSGVSGTLASLGTTVVATATTPGQAPQLAAAGKNGVLLLEDGAAGWRIHQSANAGAGFGAATPIPGVRACTIAGSAGRALEPVAATVVVGCISSSGRWSARTSTDGGSSFREADLGPAGDEAPATVVGADRTPYLLTIDATSSGSRLHLWSAKHGLPWSQRDVTDGPGRYAHARLAAASGGLLGLLVHRQDGHGRWFVLGAAFEATGPVYLVSFASHSPVSLQTNRPPGSRVGAIFDGEQRLSVVWTVAQNVVALPTAASDPTVQRDIWFVRSRVPDPHASAPVLERSTTGALPPCTIRGQVTRHDRWDLVLGPVWRTRQQGKGQEVSSFAVDPFHPARVWASNGTSVARSDDAGCTWTEVWSLEASADSMGRTAGSATVTGLVTGRSRLSSGSIWVLVSGAGGRPTVLRSPDGRQGTFVESSSGLPAVGGSSRLYVSPGNPDFAYVSTDPTGLVGGIYGTEDGGVSWSQRTTFAGKAIPTVTAMALDPLAPNSVWAVLDGRLEHSTDGTRSFAGPTLPPAAAAKAPGPVSAIGVWHDAGRTAHVLAYAGPVGGSHAHVFSSDDGGVSWSDDEQDGIEGTIESVAFGSRPDIVVVGTHAQGADGARIYHLHLEDGDYDGIGPAGVTLNLDPEVSSDARAHPTFYALAPGGFIRYAGDQVEPGSPAPAPPGLPSVSGSEQVKATTLSVAGHLTLAVGQRTHVSVSVVMPPRRPRADVYLLADTSVSMVSNLPRVTAAFADGVSRLTGDGFDVWAGVGSYKTDREPPRYQRSRDLAPLGPSLRAALDGLSAKTGHGQETQLLALRQVVVGDGLDQCTPTGCLQSPIGSVCEADPSAVGCSVMPGQQADFRPGSVAIVVHVTDTSLRNPAGTPRDASGRPDVAGVAASFKRAGVLSVGYDASGPADRFAARQDFDAMARGSGALAPPRGLDCTGDNRVSSPLDVAAGRPEVCPIGSGRALASMLAGVVRGALAEATATVTVHDPGHPPSTLLRAAVNLQSGFARQASFDVECLASGSRTISVTAVETHPRAAVAPPVSRTIEVTCVAPTSAQHVPPGAVVGGALGPVAAANPPAQGVAQQQLQQQAQQQPQSQPVILGASAEEEEVVTGLAAAGDLPGEPEPGAQTLSMTRHDDAALTSLGLLGFVGAAGSALAIRHARRRDELSCVRAQL